MTHLEMVGLSGGAPGDLAWAPLGSRCWEGDCSLQGNPSPDLSTVLSPGERVCLANPENNSKWHHGLLSPWDPPTKSLALPSLHTGASPGGSLRGSGGSRPRHSEGLWLKGFWVPVLFPYQESSREPWRGCPTPRPPCPQSCDAEPQPGADKLPVHKTQINREEPLSRPLYARA